MNRHGRIHSPFLTLIVRKTSISCRSRNPPPDYTPGRDHLSRPYIVVRSWEFVTSIRFLHQPLQPYAFERWTTNDTCADQPQSYRRFQVNFASASDAAQFIDAIRPVCPCKETGPPAPSIPTNGPPVPLSALMQPLPARSTLARYHTSAVQRPSMLPPSLSNVSALKSETQGSSQEFPPRVPRFPPYSSSDLSLAPSSDPAPAVALPYPYPAPSLGCDRSCQPSSALPPDSQFTAQSGGSGSAAPSLPVSSQQPTSTAATLAPQPTPPTATATQHNDESEKGAREAFLESLREVPELYSLTRRELENLVSVVVREPRFPRLVRRICSFVFFSIDLFSPSPGGTWDGVTERGYLSFLTNTMSVSSKRSTRCG